MKDIINKLSKKINDADLILGKIAFNKISESDSFKSVNIKDLSSDIVTKKEINIDLKIEKKSIGNYETIVKGDVNDIKKKDIGTTGQAGTVVQPTGIILKVKNDLKSDLKDVFGSGISFN